jgi:hypothetical protein
MTQVVKTKLGYKKPTLNMSTKLLASLAFMIQTLLKIVGKKSEVHPVRVKKAGFPTNIKPGYLLKKGFEFKYPFEKALEHWQKVSPEDFE